jgi:hypothetical protein
MLLGVSRAAQVPDNIAALHVVLSAEHRAALDTASARQPRMLNSLLTPALRQQVVRGGSAVPEGSRQPGATSRAGVGSSSPWP